MDLLIPTPEQELTLQTWRALALRRMPYLASALFSLRVLDAPGLGTFAVDGGHRLYIDFAAVQMTDDEGSQALLHECLHLLAGHAAQADLLNVSVEQRRIFNVATDLSINDDLRDGGCEMFADDGPFLLPSRYDLPDYQTPATYLDALLTLQRQQPAPPPQASGGQESGEGSGLGDGDVSDATGDGGGDGDAGNGAGEPDYSGCGSGAGGQPAPCELPASDDLGGNAPAAGELERQRIAVATAAAVREYASKGRGTVPGGLVEWSRAVLEPSPTPWQQVLSSYVRRGVAAKSGPFDVDLSRRHRRRHRQTLTNQSGTILGRVVVPGTYSPSPSIEAIRDTSGSMDASDLGLVTREVEAIARRMGIRGADLVVTDVDMDAYTPVRYTGQRSIEKVHGRGGTDMRVGITAALARRKTPTVLVVLTDGDTPWPDVKVRIPVIAVLVGPPEHTRAVRKRVPSWIRVVEANLAAPAERR